jgi:hypothetical protein
MEYSKIIAVTGLPGLYELVNSKSDGAIVKSLEDKSSKFVSNRIHNFSHLESIEVFTVRENVNLVEILTAMDKSKEKLPDEKNANAVKNYFEKVYPDLDFGRVYYSDLKKMIKWFSILRSNNVELALSTPAEEETPVVQEVKEEPVPEAAPEEKQAVKPKKAAAKKTVAKKEKAAEDKPKKAAAKKKAKK